MSRTNNEAPHSGVPGRGVPHSGAAQGLVLHGVDFSGADGGGAAKIRVVERDLSAPRNPVVLRGQFDRAGLVRAVLASAQDGRAHLWRVDAPSALPRELVQEFQLQPTWRSVAAWMQEFGSPRQWRSHVRQLIRREPRRTCERAMSTPMSPLNLRVFKQTWTFICEVLLPLADAGVRVDPVAVPATPSTVTICEGCSASVLLLHGWPARGYKGQGEPPKQVRADIIRRLRHAGMNIPPAIADKAVEDEEGDLLDALLLVTEPTQVAVPPDAMLESWVY